MCGGGGDDRRMPSGGGGKKQEFAVSFIILMICCRWYDRNWRQKRECWNICCAAAWCKLRAASNENLCEAKLIARGRFEANLK